MFKKAAILFLVTFICLSAFQIAVCYAARSENINEAKDNILTLLINDDYAQAGVETNKIIADYANNPALPEALFWIAEQYRWSHRFEDSNRIYQQLILKNPKGPWAERAKLNISRDNVLSLIVSEKYNEAQNALDKLVVDFAKSPELPSTIYWIGEKYEWCKKFQESKRLYQQVIQSYPTTFWAGKSRLSIARADIMDCIMSEEYDKAHSNLDKMMIDFAGDANLPETVYWIAEKYKWSNRADESSRICRLILQKFPDSKWADRAKFGVTRMDALTLSMTEDYEKAQEALDRLNAQFPGNPDLPETMYWLAHKYQWAFKLVEANRIYQQIIEKYPECVWVSDCKFNIATSDVLSLVHTGQYDRAEEALNKLTIDYASHSNLPRITMVIGEQFYKDGITRDSNGLKNEAKSLYDRATKIWNGVINKYPNSEVIPETRCWAGDCYNQLGKYDESIKCFQKVVDTAPQYKFAWHAQYMIGFNNQRLKDSGLISESDANSRIKAAYTQLLEKYPTCKEAQIAREWIDRNSSK